MVDYLLTTAGIGSIYMDQHGQMMGLWASKFSLSRLKNEEFEYKELKAEEVQN